MATPPHGRLTSQRAYNFRVAELQHPEPVLTQQRPLKVRHRECQPNVQRPATVLGDHPWHPVRLSKSDEAEHCSKEDTVPESGTQDFALLADQTDRRHPDRNVVR